MPRKTRSGRDQGGRPDPASMRPRPDAAENGLKALGGKVWGAMLQ